MLSPARVSVTRVDQSKKVEVRVMKFSPYGSPISLVFVGHVSSTNFNGFPLAGVSNKGLKGGVEKKPFSG